MRPSVVLVFLAWACHAPAPTRNATAPRASVDESDPPALAINTTALVVAPLTAPISPMSVLVDAPARDEVIDRSDPRAYFVELRVIAPDGDASGIDVALDSERPRRIPVSRARVELGSLLPDEVDLAPGEHWLFVAPLGDSGLVPRRADDKSASALARHFFVTAAAPNVTVEPTVWLRKPGGTYNAKASEHVVFDAIAFDAGGAPQKSPCTLALRAFPPNQVEGELRQPAPFALRDLPSGDYEVRASATKAARRTMVFTVNRDLGGSP